MLKLKTQRILREAYEKKFNKKKHKSKKSKNKKLLSPSPKKKRHKKRKHSSSENSDDSMKQSNEKVCHQKHNFLHNSTQKQKQLEYKNNCDDYRPTSSKLQVNFLFFFLLLINFLFIKNFFSSLQSINFQQKKLKENVKKCYQMQNGVKM